MKKILIIGDTIAHYHPLNCIFPIHKTLAEYNLTFTNDYNYFSKLNEFDLLICFIDSWPHWESKVVLKTLDKAQTDALLTYLTNDGKILSIHTGMSLQTVPGLETIHGVKYLDHPPYCEIKINLAKGHCLTEGLNDFTINDEPYHFEGYEGLDIFASYEYDSKTIPAAWEKPMEKGRLIYLMPGHDEAVFKCEEYLKLIKRCVEDMV